MSDKPILFSGPMIRAILEGRKTQTRRIMKVQPDKIWEDGSPWWNIGGLRLPKCPYGQTGGAIWVRETWAMCFRATDLAKIYYRASERKSHTEFHEMIPVEKCGNIQPSWPRWKPSIHMPRSFSRITLEVKDISVERLHDLKGWDCAAEGIMLDHWKMEEYPMHDMGVEAENRILRRRFKDLWESINGPESWNKNPWVWVVEFDVHPINIDDFIAAKDPV